MYVRTYVSMYIHNPVSLLCQLQYNPEYDVVVSLDHSAMLEYWGGVSHDYKFPNNVKFQYKTDTDLYEFAKVTMTSSIP